MASDEQRLAGGLGESVNGHGHRTLRSLHARLYPPNPLKDLPDREPWGPGETSLVPGSGSFRPRFTIGGYDPLPILEYWRRMRRGGQDTSEEGHGDARTGTVLRGFAGRTAVQD